MKSRPKNTLARVSPHKEIVENTKKCSKKKSKLNRCARPFWWSIVSPVLVPLINHEPCTRWRRAPLQCMQANSQILSNNHNPRTVEEIEAPLVALPIV